MRVKKGKSIWLSSSGCADCTFCYAREGDDRKYCNEADTAHGRSNPLSDYINPEEPGEYPGWCPLLRCDIIIVHSLKIIDKKESA